MRYIHKVFHEKSNRDFNEIYQHRLHFDSTKLLGLAIKPQKQPHRYELYYIPTNEMLNNISLVHKISREFNRTFSSLPEVAQKQFITECLIEELYNTNELEGVRSTREEIARSAREVKLNKNTNKRFDSMIRSYLRLNNGDMNVPKSPQDIRAIYDDITSDEIEVKELPDGDIFRKDITYVYKKSGTGRVIHTGITPEKKIIHEVEQLLKFMNNHDEIPMLIKVAVGHYYFGYIHPFYDGNGRTSRFMSSMYLSKVLGKISSLPLSRGCNKFRKQYLEAFEITNSIKSRGEMNYFIDIFLTIIIKTMEEMNAELKEKLELIEIAKDKLLHREPRLRDKSKKYMDIMFVIAQNYFFAYSEGITIRELAEVFNWSEATIRKYIKELLDLSLIEQKGERPAFYSIRQQYFES